MNAPPGPFAPPPPPYAPNPYAANPYAPPQAAGYVDPNAASPVGARLDAALYVPNHVGLATFLGTPFGGAVLMAINEYRMGRKSTCLKTLLAGFVGTGLLFAVAMLLPDGIPRFPISIGPLLVMGAIAKSRQGAFVQQHLAAGGKRASGWAAAGIGLLSAVVVVLPLMIVLVVAEVATGNP